MAKKLLTKKFLERSREPGEEPWRDPNVEQWSPAEKKFQFRNPQHSIAVYFSRWDPSRHATASLPCNCFECMDNSMLPHPETRYNMSLPPPPLPRPYPEPYPQIPLNLEMKRILPPPTEEETVLPKIPMMTIADSLHFVPILHDLSDIRRAMKSKITLESEEFKYSEMVASLLDLNVRISDEIVLRTRKAIREKEENHFDWGAKEADIAFRNFAVLWKMKNEFFQENGNERLARLRYQGPKPYDWWQPHPIDLSRTSTTHYHIAGPQPSTSYYLHRP